MTRKEIETTYNVDTNGIIRSPGKFEGEMLYAPYFYDAFLNGDGEWLDEITTRFEITDEDRTEFPELGPNPPNRYVDLIEDNNGFVSVS